MATCVGYWEICVHIVAHNDFRNSRSDLYNSAAQVMSDFVRKLNREHQPRHPTSQYQIPGVDARRMHPNQDVGRGGNRWDWKIDKLELCWFRV